jgi:hypothetical protein
MRTLYKLLSILSMFSAIKSGRGGRWLIRRTAMKSVAKATRKIRF